MDFLIAHALLIVCHSLFEVVIHIAAEGIPSVTVFAAFRQRIRIRYFGYRSDERRSGSAAVLFKQP